jgi:diguanylate cyclase (GGDEF)-like protein
MALRRQSERLIVVLRWLLLAAIALVLDDSGGPLALVLIPGAGFLYNLGALYVTSRPDLFRRYGMPAAYTTRALDLALVAAVPFATEPLGWPTYVLYLFPVLATGFVLAWPAGLVAAFVASGLSATLSAVSPHGVAAERLASEGLARALMLVLGALVAEFLARHFRREHEMQQGLDRLSALYRLGSSLGRNREPRAFLDLISELAIHYAGARQCSVVFTSPGVGRIGITASRAGAAVLKTPWPEGHDGRSAPGDWADHPSRERGGPEVRMSRGASDDEVRIEVPLIGESGSSGTLELALLGIEDSLSEIDKQALSIFATQASTALENASLVAQLERAAESDSLTGLLNKRTLFERLNVMLQRAREQGTVVSVLMLDLDGFKAYNDRFGHLAGDNALVAVADVLRKNTRGDDIRCRFGGDEFLLVLPLCEREHAARIADAIRRDTAALSLTPGGAEPLGLRLSIGIATFPADASTGAELLQAADDALLRDREVRRQRASASVGACLPEAVEGALGGGA